MGTNARERERDHHGVRDARKYISGVERQRTAKREKKGLFLCIAFNSCIALNIVITILNVISDAAGFDRTV